MERASHGKFSSRMITDIAAASMKILCYYTEIDDEENSYDESAQRSSWVSSSQFRCEVRRLSCAALFRYERKSKREIA